MKEVVFSYLDLLINNSFAIKIYTNVLKYESEVYICTQKQTIKN